MNSSSLNGCGLQNPVGCTTVPSMLKIHQARARGYSRGACDTAPVAWPRRVAPRFTARCRAATRRRCAIEGEEPRERKSYGLNFTDIESEAILLNAVMEIIDSMVNFETLELKGQDPDSEISFPRALIKSFSMYCWSISFPSSCRLRR